MVLGKDGNMLRQELGNGDGVAFPRKFLFGQNWLDWAKSKSCIP